MDELWRVTSAVIDRSVNRNKSPWIPARVPIPSSGELDQVFFLFFPKKNLWQKNLCYLLLTDAIDFIFVKTIVIEASTDSGGIGLDDIRLKKVSCSSNYFR